MLSDTRTCARVLIATVLVLGGATPLAAATPGPAASTPAAAMAMPANPPQRLRVEVVNVYPHDPAAFTQGLLLHEGVLFESTGLEGRSSLREVELTTGQVKRELDLAPSYFGEGLALVGDQLIQLTWKNHVAFAYELATFKSVGQYSYQGEGWGLCFDGQRLIRSDGSDTLFFHDAKTFAPIGQMQVTMNGRPIRQVNELECVDGLVYANVWQTDSLVVIDPRNGHITAVIDGSGLLTPAERAQADVLNGIAWDPAKKTFYITGKLWPKLFEVRFVPVNQ